jgi:K+-sensing histidine kinase KdpD
MSTRSVLPAAPPDRVAIVAADAIPPRRATTLWDASGPATARGLRYGLAVASVAIALALALVAERYMLAHLAFPLFLMAIAAAVWYGGGGPGALAIALSGMAFNFFFTDPRYSFYIHASDRPYFLFFVLFALMIGWFAARRRHVERELRLAHDELEVEVVKRTEQASLLDLTHDSIFVRGMDDDIITYWNHGAEELFGWTAEDAIGKSAHDLLQTALPMTLDEIHAELERTGRWGARSRS